MTEAECRNGFRHCRYRSTEQECALTSHECNTPGWTRTSDPGIRNLRRDNFAVPEETTKSTVSLCPSTTSGSTSDFASTASFTAQRAEKAADLRNPQIQSWPSRTND